MTQPIPLTDSVIAIEVPELAVTQTIYDISENNAICFYGFDDYIIGKPEFLPPGTWQIISLAREVNEEVAKGIFPDTLFKETDHRHAEFKEVPRMERFKSLMASKSMDTTKNYILLKQIK